MEITISGFAESDCAAIEQKLDGIKKEFSRENAKKFTSSSLKMKLLMKLAPHGLTAALENITSEWVRDGGEYHLVLTFPMETFTKRPFLENLSKSMREINPAIKTEFKKYFSNMK